MKNPLQILEEAQNSIEEFVIWKDKNKRPTNFADFAEEKAEEEGVFRYAAIFYPEFIKVDDFIVVTAHYTEENWQNWRKTLDARHAAQIINHLHVEDFLYNDFIKQPDHLGEIIAFFWQMAVNNQFPEDKVVVEYDGDVINVYQPF